MAAKGKVRIRNREDGSFVAVIADEDTVTGFLLAGVGGLDSSKKSNFLVVDAKTKQAQIEETFKAFTKREDIGIILISQYVANDIRYLLDEYDQVVPTILEIPSKDHPYDSSKDSLMAKVRRMTGIRD
eukprot:TRINITY_DN2240_c0_g3_i1.p1 TRINITY_DN2240_c0_g3~~TRINITY_DN2240_c0_g3_i1.p1  ORF type:complete len:128 (-),score=32.51 TRINITY_DN2240_c0_g3_i1:121-504(-)